MVVLAVPDKEHLRGLKAFLSQRLATQAAPLDAFKKHEIIMQIVNTLLIVVIVMYIQSDGIEPWNVVRIAGEESPCCFLTHFLRR